MWWTGSSPQSSAESPWAAQREAEPRPLRSEDQGYSRLPGALLGRALGSRLPRTSPTRGPYRTGQGRAEQAGSIPSTQKDIMQVKQA